MSRILTSLILLILALPAQAAWVTIRNDTKETIVVREVVTVKGKAVPGKPVKLMPGETLREFQPAVGIRTIQLMETKDKLLGQHDIDVKDKDVLLSIAALKGQVKLIVVDPTKKK